MKRNAAKRIVGIRRRVASTEKSGMASAWHLVGSESAAGSGIAMAAAPGKRKTSPRQPWLSCRRRPDVADAVGHAHAKLAAMPSSAGVGEESYHQRRKYQYLAKAEENNQ
jgi:hypothetical protein